LDEAAIAAGKNPPLLEDIVILNIFAVRRR